MISHVILPIAIVKVIVIYFRFFFEIAANAKQKYKSKKYAKITIYRVTNIIASNGGRQDFVDALVSVLS